MANKDNPGTGREFEELAMKYFQEFEHLDLDSPFSIEISAGDHKAKGHCFDLGSAKNNIIVECKCHSWTKGKNVPSAKMSVWNEAMYYFMLAPAKYRKIIFVKKCCCAKRNTTLAEYYIDKYLHLIPPGVEIMEYDLDTGKARQVPQSKQ